MKLYTNAIQIIEAKIGLISNNEYLVHVPEFLCAETQRKNPQIWSLLTALPPVREILFEASGLDACFYMMDVPGSVPDVILEHDKCMLFGDLSSGEASMTDLRWNIFGNMGIFFAYSLVALERYCGIHSMHASALYNEDENRLLIVAGSTGSGKTVLQLKALLEYNYTIFSTEMTHFRVTDSGSTFFKGSIYDNIRIGNLVYDFPAAIKKFNIVVPEVEDTWESYLAVDFSDWSSGKEVLENPEVIVLFPKIESKRTDWSVNTRPDKDGFIKAMFENAAEKICKSQVMHNGSMAFASFDAQDLAQKRLADIRRLLALPNVRHTLKMLANPGDCWKWEEAIRQ